MGALSGLSRDEILRMDVRELLDRFRRMPRETGPVVLPGDYLARVARQEAADSNRPGADKSWVHRAIARFDRTARAAVLRTRP